MIPTTGELLASGLKCLAGGGGGIHCFCKDLPNCNLLLPPPTLGTSSQCPSSASNINHINLVGMLAVLIVAAVFSG